MIPVHMPKWWQLSLASTLIVGSAIASGGNYASAQTGVTDIKPVIRVTTPTQQVTCDTGYRYNSLTKKCEPIRTRPTLPEGSLSIPGNPPAVPLPPQVIASLKQQYPQAFQQLKQEDRQALQKLREGDPATLQRLQQLEPRTTQILQPYLQQRIQAQPQIRQVPIRNRWRN